MAQKHQATLRSKRAAPYSALMVSHVSRMLEEHKETVRQVLEDDPTFDPFADDDLAR